MIEERLEWSLRHPAEYIALRKEQMERCKFKNGKVKKMHRHAYDYYVRELAEFKRVLRQSGKQ